MYQTVLDTVRSVQHVKDCRIIEENGEIGQLFVEAYLTASDDEQRTQEIKGIIRSILGALAIKHNLDLDYRKVKVVEFKSDEESMEEVHPRIQIVAAYQRRLPRPEIVVELHCFNNTYVGTAPNTGDAAQDTFAAFNQAFQQMGFGNLQLIYLQILTNDLSQERIVLVKVNYTRSDQIQDELLGVAEIQEELPLAVVKAILSAVNRRIIIAYPNRT
ncbi:MAG: hypothetical protein GX331_01360 [Firmicutes bacterium]|jgi:hypothetical protein|nr:hypothetical protein [Bacillota bacterium]